MKIRCDVCERTEAALLCCADEAALCWVCDANVHAANKLARKHQRVPLLTPISSSAPNAQMPTCDVCQEKAGYFFCLEDRALLCRNCDAGIHTSSPHGTSHRRFLITGVRVALQHYLANSTTSNSNNNDASNNSISDGDNGSNYIITPALSDLSTPNKNAEGEGEQWTWRGDVLDSAEFDHCYGISKPGSSSQQSKKDEKTRHGGIS